MRKRMMKFLLIASVALPVSGFAQKLKTSRYDATEKQWRFETFPVNVKSSPGAKMNISFKALDTVVYLQLKGSGAGTSTVDKDDQVILYLDNNAKVSGYSLKLQSIEYGEALPSYQHDYRISVRDLETLSKYNLRSVKKFSVGGVEDIALDSKNLAALKQASTAMVEAMKKEIAVNERPTMTFAPGFPGGNDVYLNFLNRNFRTPEELKTNVQLNVKVSFTVLEDGTPTGFEVQAPDYTGLDKELQRILLRMPKWKPGFENSKAIAKRVEHTLKISKIDTSTRIFF